jgi:hypothetical protein
MKFNLLPVKYKDLTIYVTNDYYKEEYRGRLIRMPIDRDSAYDIAEENDMIVPNVEMVDAIWSQADIKLNPTPMTPTKEMTTLPYFEKHDRLINRQIEELGYKQTEGLLIAGHKKDIVYNDPSSNRIAIYGWHRSNGRPIQPYSTVHGKYYADYSHGLRLVSKDAIRNGEKVRLEN